MWVSQDLLSHRCVQLLTRSCYTYSLFCHIAICRSNNVHRRTADGFTDDATKRSFSPLTVSTSLNPNFSYPPHKAWHWNVWLVPKTSSFPYSRSINHIKPWCFLLWPLPLLSHPDNHSCLLTSTTFDAPTSPHTTPVFHTWHAVLVLQTICISLPPFVPLCDALSHTQNKSREGEKRKRDLNKAEASRDETQCVHMCFSRGRGSVK